MFVIDSTGIHNFTNACCFFKGCFLCIREVFSSIELADRNICKLVCFSLLYCIDIGIPHLQFAVLGSVPNIDFLGCKLCFSH